MNRKLHQPNALELTGAPSDRARPHQARYVLISDDYYDNTGIEVQPHCRPDNEVIETGRSVHPYRRYDEGDCKGDVNCEAEMFIRLEHQKFEQTKWKSIKK